MAKYYNQLEAWEQAAYDEEWGCDWLEEVGEGVKFYAMLCEAVGKRPTFAGLMRHLATKAARREEGQDTKSTPTAAQEPTTL